MAQTVAPGDPFLRQQNKADGGEANALQFPAVQQVDQNGKRRGGEPEEVNGVQKENRHAWLSPSSSDSSPALGLEGWRSKSADSR